MSSAQLEEGLTVAGATPVVQAEVIALYEAARVEAFQAGVAFLVFLGMAGLLLSIGLEDRKLIEADEPAVVAAT